MLSTKEALARRALEDELKSLNAELEPVDTELMSVDETGPQASIWNSLPSPLKVH